jgi:hypothetical protein
MVGNQFDAKNFARKQIKRFDVVSSIPVFGNELRDNPKFLFPPYKPARLSPARVKIRICSFFLPKVCAKLLLKMGVVFQQQKIGGMNAWVEQKDGHTSACQIAEVGLRE